MHVNLTALSWVFGIVFGAGVFYAVVTVSLQWIIKRSEESEARLKAQIDGVGRKVNAMQADWKTEHDRLVGCLILDTAARLMEGKPITELENIVRRLLMD
jgi:hypothetical protein